VVNQQKVKEWLLKRTIQKEDVLLELDIIVIIQAQDGNQDIGLVKLGKNETIRKIY
jgi:hypothetical protein